MALSVIVYCCYSVHGADAHQQVVLRMQGAGYVPLSVLKRGLSIDNAEQASQPSRKDRDLNLSKGAMLPSETMQLRCRGERREKCCVQGAAHGPVA